MKVIKHLCLVLTFGFISQTKAAVFYNSLSSSISDQGFVNGPNYFGDALTISGTSAIIDSLTFRVASVSIWPPGPTSTPGNFQALFYNINAGADGVYQTGDETFGSLLGSSSLQNFSISDGTNVTLSGFSVNVPQNFLWIVYNPDLSITVSDVRPAGYATVTGGSSATTSGYWSSTAPAAGGSLKFLAATGVHGYGSDFAVQLTGSMVPEPSAGALLMLGAGGIFALRRLRRKED